MDIGLALGGGGARGMAHLGVLKMLEENQIRIGALAGTSIGGLVGAVYLAGRHYLGAGVTHQVTPLITLSSTVFANLGDASFTVSPSLEYNIATDVYVSVGASIGVGPGPEEDGSGSEFGGYPDYAFAALRVYF